MSKDRIPIIDGPYWYAVHTAPQNEDKADKGLRQQGYMTFYPFVRQRLRRKLPGQDRHRVEWVERPYFPRYLFVALRFEHEEISAVNDTDGVSTVVYTGGTKSEREYLRIPDRVMNALMRIGDGKGFIGEEDTLRVGSKFNFLGNSPFAGLIGTISSVAGLDATGQIRAFVELFGSRREVKVSVRNIGAVEYAR